MKILTYVGIHNRREVPLEDGSVLILPRGLGCEVSEETAADVFELGFSDVVEDDISDEDIE